MSSEAQSLTVESIDAFGASARAPAPPPPLFWAALVCAALLHAAFLVGFGRSGPRYLEAGGGSGDPIDVELVDEAALRAMTPTQNPPAAPAAAPQPRPQPAPEAQQEPPSEKAQPEPEAAKAAETAPAEKKKQKADVPVLETEAPQEAPPDTSTPEAIIAEARKAEAKRKSAAKPAQKSAPPKLPDKLDLTLPFDMTMAGTTGGGGSSSATRPPGVTRSGENDRFGRDVIRALQKMMPPQRGMRGRVVIRLVLNERGNVATVQVVESSGDRNLDHDVAFSAYQASFPFPPKGATLVDRTFRVGYTYR
jgi:TonB family protein